MPRPRRPWFRFYTEAVHDRKMRRLTPAQRWLWVAVLAAARESCISGYLMVSEREPYSWDDLADYAGMKLKEVEQGTDRMHDLGMLDFDADLGAWFVPKWNERQFETDDVTERTRKHRSQEQGRNVPTSQVGTPPETETEAETNTESEKLQTLVVVTDDGAPIPVVFHAWKTATNRNGNTLLTPERRRTIEKALALGYPVEDLVDAVKGWRHSPHHRGENDRQTVYNDIDVLLRNAKQIETFRDLERGKGRPPPTLGKSQGAIERALERGR